MPAACHVASTAGVPCSSRSSCLAYPHFVIPAKERIQGKVSCAAFVMKPASRDAARQTWCDRAGSKSGLPILGRYTRTKLYLSAIRAGDAGMVVGVKFLSKAPWTSWCLQPWSRQPTVFVPGTRRPRMAGSGITAGNRFANGYAAMKQRAGTVTDLVFARRAVGPLARRGRGVQWR